MSTSRTTDGAPGKQLIHEVGIAVVDVVRNADLSYAEDLSDRSTSPMGARLSRPAMQDRFWPRLQELLDRSELVIDRPEGCRHPRFPDRVYPLDYGFLQGTSAVDGQGVDVWLGSLPERKLVGLICTVDLGRCDAEIKLLVACTEEECQAALRFQNEGLMAGILVRRDAS